VKKTEDKKDEAWSAFDVTGPSLLVPSLRRADAALQRKLNTKAECDPMPKMAWSIGQTDPNIKFLAENRRNFGTRKIRART